MLILGCLLIVALPWASHWYLLGGGTETAAVDAKAGGQMQLKDDGEQHSLVLFTVVDISEHIDRPQMVRLEARMEITGVRNLYRVCMRLPHVMEAILETLNSGSDIVDRLGQLRLASQHGRVRLAINQVLKQDTIRSVRLEPVLTSSSYATPRSVCSRAEQTMRQLTGDPA